MRCHRSRALGLASPKWKLWWSQARPGFFSRGCTWAYLMGIAPEPSDDPRGVGQGSSLFGSHWTQGLTYPFVRISSGAPEPFVASLGVMVMKGWIRSSGDRTLLGGDDFHRQGCCALLGAFFSNVMGAARLSRLSDDGADPFVSLCCVGLRLERGLDELV
jgi:hypothetical protein